MHDPMNVKCVDWLGHCLLYVDNARLLLSEVDCFRASWKETTIQSFNIFFAPRKHCALLKISFSCFLGFFFFYYSYSKVL